MLVSVPLSMLRGPAVDSMVGRSEEENGRAVVATAALTEVTRSLEVVDFEKLLSDLSAAFIRVAVEEIDREIERWLLRIVFAVDVDRGTVMFIDPVDDTLIVTHQVARGGGGYSRHGFRRQGELSLVHSEDSLRRIARVVAA